MDKRNAFPKPLEERQLLRFRRKSFGPFRAVLKGANVVTPFTPLSADFQIWRETQWMLVVRKQTLGRVSCLLSTFIQVPKLDVAGSIPVSRSIESTVCKSLFSACSICAPITSPANVALVD